MYSTSSPGIRQLKTRSYSNLKTLLLQLSPLLVLVVFRYIYIYKEAETCKKGKAIPLQACIGPDGSRRLRFPDSKTISTLS